ncbi:hypothetical protein CLV99_0216 [Sphingobacterium yanglingense]|uniref:Transposase n=1 Tax=Sphingobacterium yanglingense TaxID=1437280 RepID=A0A4R6WT11_9SPHI|nr:hypothetical protein CLV99_0216 [Sphingobacterium yanglingense]
MSGKYYGRFSKIVRDSAIDDILAGRLLVEEVMDKYRIRSKATVVSWVQRHRKKSKQNIYNQ